MKLEHNQINQKYKQQTAFKGPIDGVVTSALMAIDTNPMVNAALVDTFAMVLPRTYVDTKKRNKYAGAETFIREASSTIIVCLSAGGVAKLIASIYNKLVNKDIKISPKLWASSDSFDFLKESWNQSKNTKDYAKNVFENILGQDGKNVSTWKKIDWQNVHWYDDKNWEKINWKNPKFKNIHQKLKNEGNIIEVFTDLINDKTAHKHDVKKMLGIIEHRVANALGASGSVEAKFEEKTLKASLKDLIRDTHDLGKGIFTQNNINLKNAELKLKSMNKVKTFGSIGLVATAGLAAQFVNRQITKKRLGKDDFVGTLQFGQNGEEIPSNFSNNKKQSRAGLLASKIAACAGIFGLSMATMKVKSPRQFLKNLEFTSGATSGNVIKTIYTALLMGRFLAARDQNELRESVTRDYLGFLNWLVFGGFVSKGVAQLLFDKKQENLFNINGKGKGIGHWLGNVSLKSHSEIAAKGNEFAKKNIWKLNVAHASGLLYSGLALGFALPLLNIFITGKQESGQRRAYSANELKFASRNSASGVFKNFGV